MEYITSKMPPHYESGQNQEQEEDREEEQAHEEDNHQLPSIYNQIEFLDN